MLFKREQLFKKGVLVFRKATRFCLFYHPDHTAGPRITIVDLYRY